MTAPVLLASSVLAVVLTVALIHQVRVRRGLERLLSRIVAELRRRHPHENTDDAATGGVDDRDRVSDDRM